MKSYLIWVAHDGSIICIATTANALSHIRSHEKENQINKMCAKDDCSYYYYYYD